MNCILCGRSFCAGRFCCVDHKNLYDHACKELKRAPMTMAEALGVWEMTMRENKPSRTDEQMPLIPRGGR